MISEEMQHPNAVSSFNGEETQPKDLSGEDPDKIRREVFKRMFPEVPEKPSE